jgi:hypothetical protein
MILLARRLTPTELRLQSDREIPKSEIYFTNHTLTGNRRAIRSGSQTRAGDPKTGPSVTPSFGRWAPFLFHQSHFDWEHEFVRFYSGSSQALAFAQRSFAAELFSPIAL